jgi:DNA phosphorothioation-dependent restriction protein DptH
VIKGICSINKAILDRALTGVIVPKLKAILETRGPGHCMKVSDLDASLMVKLSDELRKQGTHYQVVVLTEQDNKDCFVTSTKLVELRNPDEHGNLRAPMLVFVPNELKTSSEDSFGIATFEQIDLSECYRWVYEVTVNQCPEPPRMLLEEIYYLLNQKAGFAISWYQWAKYCLSLAENDFDASVLGAALYELSLLPDLELHIDRSSLARRLAKNHACVQLLRLSEKSAIATVYELQLEGDALNKDLALYLNQQDSLLGNTWLRQLVTDSKNWGLTFDKWQFQYEDEATDSICIKVTGLSLPVIPEDEPNPSLQELIGQQILTVDQGGLKTFGVSFEQTPKPSEVNGLAKFKAQVFTQQGDFVGLIKVAKASSRSAVTINFNKLTGIDWQEGWHYVRIQAFDDNDDLIPLIDEHENPIPWGTAGAEQAGDRPNESDLFYVLPAAEVDVEPVNGKKAREVSLTHGLIKAGFSQLIDAGVYIRPEVLERRWVDSKNKAEVLLDVKFKKTGAIQIPLPRFFRDFEQKIINNCSSALTWRMEIRNEVASKPSPDYIDWPVAGVEDCYKSFLNARSEYFYLIKGDNNLVSVAHDFSSTRQQAFTYAQSYLDYLLAVYNNILEGANYTKALSALLALDSVELTLWQYDGTYKQARLLGPTHPLRVLWLSGWSSLADYWANQCAKVAKEIAVSTRNSVLEDLHLGHFPHVLPDTYGQLLVAVDNIHPFWSVLAPAHEKEPQGLIDAIKSALSIPSDYQQSGKQSGVYLATKVERYLIQHPYVSCLAINAFNVGSASVIAQMLSSIKKKKELSHIHFDIRLFVADPYAADVGTELFHLLDNERESKVDDIDLSGIAENPLVPRLSIALRPTEEFVDNATSYNAHLSMLFDVFPAEEVSVMKLQADEQVAPVHGLYQDYCTDYIDENGIVAWERYARHGSAQPLFVGQPSELLSTLPQVMSAMTASSATGKFSLERVPVVRLALDSSEKALLNQLHEVSDWVFTIDRNIGIEFFDHGGKEGRPDYLIDHSPEMKGASTHNFVITSRSTSEIVALLRGTLELHQIIPDIKKAIRVLDSLRALSGRLALKLASNSASKSEALGLALAKLYLEYQGVFNNQIVVPLDAHLELYTDLQKADAELGGEISLKRTDLALFDLDVSSRMIRCNLVEVKCYSEVGDLGKYEGLKKRIAEQISESERVIQRHFDLERTTPDRPDRLIKTQRLCELLEHYLKRSERFGLLSQEVVDEAKFLLRTLEQGYRLAITRSAVIFDFAQTSSGIENEVGIEFHRVGRSHIDELLSSPIGDETEATLDTLELTLPRLNSANFLFKQRERTVSWDQIVLTTPKVQNSELTIPIAEVTGGGNEARYPGQITETRKVKEEPISVEKLTCLNTQKQMPESEPVTRDESASESAKQVEPESKLTSQEDTALEKGAVPNKVLLDDVGADEAYSVVVPHDIVLGVNGDSIQFGLLGEVSGRKVALDLNHTHTISLFGVQGGGKSYTLGSVVEMATVHVPHINQLLKLLSTVIFHYSSTQDYKPEFTSMITDNDDSKQLQMLKEHYGADPISLKDVVLLTPVDKLEQRKAEYPGIEVHALKFSSAELQAGHWKFLMGAVGNQAAYIRQMTNIMRQNRQGLTLEGLKQSIENSRMSDSMKDLAMMRLDFAKQYIDDTLGVSNLIRPGRMIIVDLRDEFIEKDEALGLFVVLLQIFSEAKYQGETFNKLIVFDECHKYIDSPDLVKGLIEVVREMRHKGTSVMIASQDPPSVPVELIELSSQIILHKFNSPAWLKHIQKANSALNQLTPQKLASLQPGEAYVWSSKASDAEFTRQAIKIQCRPRVTKHGGDTKTAV